MKRLVTAITALAIMTLAGAAFAADGSKIASVDLRKIALESKAGAAATADLKKNEGQIRRKPADKRD